MFTWKYHVHSGLNDLFVGKSLHIRGLGLENLPVKRQ